MAAFSTFLQLNTTLEGMDDLRALSVLLADEQDCATATADPPGEPTAQRRRAGTIDPGRAAMTERQYIAHQTLTMSGGGRPAAAAIATTK